MDSPLDLSVPSVQPVNLPPPTSEFDPPAGTIVTASGWGATSIGGSLSSELRSVDVPVVSDADCDKAYGGTPTFPQVFQSMMCAGDTSNGRRKQVLMPSLTKARLNIYILLLIVNCRGH